MSRGLAGVIYGTEGMGKTSLGLQFPGPVWCKSIKETGYDDLHAIGAVPANSMNTRITSWEHLVQETKKCASGTLLIDSCTGLQTQLAEFVCREAYRGNWEAFNSYTQGLRKECVAVFQNYLDLCTDLSYKGINVLFIAHQGTTTLPNALGADAVAHIIKMDDGEKGGLRSSLTAWASFVLFLNNDIRISQALAIDKQSKMATEGKAMDGDRRIIHTTNSVAHQAKNRWNLPPTIPMGQNAKQAFDNLWKVIPAAFKKEAQTVQS